MSNNYAGIDYSGPGSTANRDPVAGGVSQSGKELRAKNRRVDKKKAENIQRRKHENRTIPPSQKRAADVQNQQKGQK